MAARFQVAEVLAGAGRARANNCAKTLVGARTGPHLLDSGRWEEALRDGFYAVEFRTPLATGSGVIFLQNGLLRGGDYDSMMYYTGNYELDGDNFTAEITTNADAKPPGMVSVFGRDNIRISLKGSFSGDNAKLTGTASEAPGIELAAHLKKIGP